MDGANDIIMATFVIKWILPDRYWEGIEDFTTFIFQKNADILHFA